MELVFLGTGSMMPTKERAQTALVLNYREECFLFDCGEGTQRQLRMSGLSPARITKIFLTHWHGDHFLGLPGLLENLAKHKDEKIIDVYGPKHTKRNVQQLVEAFFLRNKIAVMSHEITRDGIFLEGRHYVMRATKIKHGVPCVAYTFEEKPKRKVKMDELRKKGVPEGPLIKSLQEGKSIVFRGKTFRAREFTFVEQGKKVAIVLDTKMDASCVKAAKGADVLVCESTFHSELQKKARAYYHMTSKEAGKLAKKAKAKKLILTHFSQRYTSIDELEKEAKKEFSNTVSSHDFMRVSV